MEHPRFPIILRQSFIICLWHSERGLSERKQLAIRSCTIAIFSRIAFEGAACVIDGPAAKAAPAPKIKVADTIAL